MLKLDKQQQRQWWHTQSERHVTENIKISINMFRLCAAPAAASAAHILPLVRNVAIKNWLANRRPSSLPRHRKR